MSTDNKNITFWFARKPLFGSTGSLIHGRVEFLKLVLIVIIAMTRISVTAEDIFVGGQLEEDETWTKENTYIVFKDLRIPEGISLTIQAGVTVKIDQGRGIFVLGGTMTVDGRQGEMIDSVNFFANHVSRLDGWKWKGISYIGVSGEGLNKIAYAKIIDAEIAVGITASEEVIVENSSIIYNQHLGVRLLNSKNCQITYCLLQNNYDGIEMIAEEGRQTSGNIVRSCILKNFNHNIYMSKASGGMFMNNLVESNIIEGSNNGIWMDNGGGASFGKNTITKNVFVANGSGAGYGLLLALDSITVTNNIFWKNHIAIFYDPFTGGSYVANNSSYRDDNGILLTRGSVENQFLNNTFSINEYTVYTLDENAGIIFSHNNIFAKPGQEEIIINKYPYDVSISSNFWNTTSDSDIEKMIWDHSDDPTSGAVNFKPILQDADTTNPVSPPMDVIKQLVDGQVKLSWSSNPENDIRAYKVYDGGFENYAFSNATEAGNDTVFFLSSDDIYDSIAVTALDHTINPVDAQVMGHESPFAFATIYPYAGNDDVVCKKNSAFRVSEATIPFEHQSFNWSSGGDGNFSDVAVLEPVYYPGPADLLLREVVLTLEVLKDGVVQTDHLTLNIIDDPFVFAGNDTVIFAGSDIELLTALAQYQETNKWLTGGDGVFNNDTLVNAIYTPGNGDMALGEVELVLEARSVCGTVTDTLRLVIEPFFSIEGKLWFNDNPVQDAVVLAVIDIEDAARATDIADAGVDGFFRFDRLVEGNYSLYAVPDTALTNGTVPGYYANNLRWQDAHYFQLNADIFDVDIMLPSLDYVLPHGEGSVSGYFILPETNLFSEDIFCNSFFEMDDKSDFCNGGLSNITVFLYNSTGTKLLDYTLTDKNGNFYFNNLPFGNFTIDAEKAGYLTTASSVITLSPGHKHETGVVLELSGKKIGIHSSANTSGNILLAVYPNPAKHFIHIPIPENTNGATSVRIYNSFGQMVMQNELPAGNNPLQDHFKLDISPLNAGVYFGRMVQKGATSGFTFLKE